MTGGDDRRPIWKARWVWLLFVVLLYLILQFHGPRGGEDDDVRYATALSDQSLIAFLKARYEVWSGRLVIDAATLLVINHVWFWRLLNAALAGLFVWAVLTAIGRSHDRVTTTFLAIGFFLLDTKMVRDSVFWMSGSFNYLWPAALGALACLPFVHAGLPRKLFVVTLPAAIYAAFQEQTAALMLGFQVVLGARLVLQKCWHRWHALQILAVAASFGILMLSPGSAARYGVNVRHWFPEYGMLTLSERAFSGLQLAFGHAFGPGHAIGLLLTALLLLVTLGQRHDRLTRLIAAIPLGIALLPAISAQFLNAHNPGAPVLRWLATFSAGHDSSGYRSYWIGNVSNATDSSLYLNFLIGFVAATSTAVALHTAFGREGPWPRTLAVLVWLAALTSSAMVGFSPTLYLSGQRIFFMQDLLMLALSAALFTRIPHPQTQRRILWAMTPVAALGLMMV